ncbi:MAG: hypothetical protein GTN80_02500 [Nitrososphaeria archaeon]|nr:hypothetical protein [Nitrososphaeria archaeon]NIN52045.1 hypothetical protein [Nitrososphaeria archaeon]NIQ32506.1 hypothetical protein [Nitrososphaeria archaeon]
MKADNVQSKREILTALIELMLIKSTPVCALTAALGVATTGILDPKSITMVALIFGTLMGGFFSLDSVKDIEADKINKPDRPIPSGRLSIKQAESFVVILFSLSVLFIITLYASTSSLQTLLLAFLGLVLAISYTLPPTLSRIPLLSNAILASLFTIFPLLTGWTLFKPLNQAPFFIIGALFFLAWGDIEDFEDVEGDEFVGIKTLPILIGIKKAAVVFSLIVSLSLIIGVYAFLTDFKSYWLISLPQQFTMGFLILQLIKTQEKNDIFRIHYLCQILSISTGLTLLIGYILLG